MDYIQVYSLLNSAATNQELKIYQLLTNNLNFPCLVNHNNELLLKLEQETEKKQAIETQIKIKGIESSTVCSGEPEQVENQVIQLLEQKQNEKQQFQGNAFIQKNQAQNCECKLNYEDKNEYWLNFIDHQSTEKKQFENQQEQYLMNVSHPIISYDTNDDFNFLQFGNFSKIN